MSQAGMQPRPLPDVGLDHNIVLEVEQEGENILSLVNAGEWASVLQNLQRPESRWRSNIAQLLQPMNDDKDTIVHLAAFSGKTEVVQELLLLIKKEDNQELWRERQANIQGNNPLHLAACNGHEDTCKCIADMAPDLAKATNAFRNTPLHLAAYNGHTDTCKCIADMAPDLAKATNAFGNTPLHLAACNGHTDTCKCIADVAPDLAKATNAFGNTPLHLAAESGKTDTYRCLAEMAPETAMAMNEDGDTPIFMVDPSLTPKFLDVPGIALARRKDGNTILHLAISGGYFDLACSIIEKFKELIYERNERGLTPLHLLANNPYAFRSGCRLGLLGHLFYSSIKVSIESKSDDIKLQEEGINTFKSPCQSRCLQGTYGCIKITLEKLVELIKLVGLLLFICLVLISAIFGFSWWKWIDQISEIRKKKQKHEWVKKVMKQLVDNIDDWSKFSKNNTGKYHLGCTRDINPAMLPVEEIPSSASHQEKQIALGPDTGTSPRTHSSMHSSTTCTSPNQQKEDNKRGIIESPFLIAGKKGVKEMVEEILNKFPLAIYDTDLEDKNIMQLAAEHRQHEIYEFLLGKASGSLLGKASGSLLRKVDAEGNSVLHLAAKYPQGQSVLIPGAASQMYYEYSWFKFVEESMPPHLSNRLNHKGHTAMEVFIKTHQELAMERANWLRYASQSCSVVAALITTIAFATISSVPGGLQQDNGSPVFQSEAGFDTFSISSFMAFCFSALSLIMFLGILFFPNHDLDFGNNRPSNLIWGINSLFVSIVAMFLSFFSGDLLMIDKKTKYFAYPTFAFTLFMAISRSPFYSEFTRQAAFYSEFPDQITSHIPKRAYPNNLSF